MTNPGRYAIYINEANQAMQVKERLQRIAVVEGTSVNGLINEALMQLVRRREKKNGLHWVRPKKHQQPAHYGEDL